MRSSCRRPTCFWSCSRISVRSSTIWDLASRSAGLIISSRSSKFSRRAIWGSMVIEPRSKMASSTHDATRLRELISLDESDDGFAVILGIIQKNMTRVGVALLRGQVLCKAIINNNMDNRLRSAYRLHGRPSRRFPPDRPSEAGRVQITLSITTLFRMQPLHSEVSERPKTLHLVSKRRWGVIVPQIPIAD